MYPYGQVARHRPLCRPAAGESPSSSSGDHCRITFAPTLGCPAQAPESRGEAFRRLALTGKEHGLLAGCLHEVAHRSESCAASSSPGSIGTTAFVRALLAVELGDDGHVGWRLQEVERMAGPGRVLNERGEPVG
ncbi:DUF6420 family protein [Streptomyces virginiae]|uniref:DUF6420 family protein n=1 Tax=Streptomyces virginiae TaxID=1961 RepID=UPI0036FEAAFD